MEREQFLLELESLLQRMKALQKLDSSPTPPDEKSGEQSWLSLHEDAVKLLHVGDILPQEEETQNSYQHLEMLYSLDQAVLSGERLENIAQLALSYLRKIKPWFRSRVMVFDFDEGEVVNLLSQDADGNSISGDKTMPLSDFSNLNIWQRGEMLQIEDMQLLPNPGPFERKLLAAGVRADLSIPLMAEDELLGFLAVSQDNPCRFNSEWIKIFNSTAEHLAVALLQSRLRDSLQRQTGVLENKIAHQTEALLQERDLISAILDTAGALVVIADADGHILRFNRACERLSGLALDEVQGKTFWQLSLIPEEEREHLKTVFAQLKTGRFPHYNENHWQRLNGEKRLLAWSNTVLANAFGEVEYLVGIAIDITEQRAAEKALRENRAFLEGIISTAMDAIITVDAQQNIMFFNDAAGEIFGYEAETVIGRPLNKLLPSNLHNEHTRHFESFEDIGLSQLTMPKPGEVWGYRADGTTFPLEAMISKVAISGQNYFTVILRDITARKQAEAEKEKLFTEVSRQREQLRQLTHNVVMAAEVERERLSRELHDEAGQSLTALKYSLSAILAEMPDAGGGQVGSTNAIRRRLQQGIDLCETTMQRIRLVAHNLRPTTLNNVGINLTLEGFCREFGESTDLHIDYSGVEFAALGDLIEITLYRCLQESLTNVARHAGADHVWVALNMSDGEITLSVEDDGRGFEVQAVLDLAGTQKGIGLLGIQERLEQLHGRLEIDSHPGGGTLVLVHIPHEASRGNSDEAN